MISAIDINKGYLYRRPLPYLNYSSCGRGFIGSCTVPSVLDSWGFGLISRLNSNNLDHRYGLTTVN